MYTALGLLDLARPAIGVVGSLGRASPIVTTRVAAPDDRLLDACGDPPKWLCEQVFEASDGNETLSELVSWLVDRPLTILFILLVAAVTSTLARRFLGRTVRRVVAPNRENATRRLQRIGIDRPEILIGASPTDPRIEARREARAASIAGVVGSTVTVVIWTIAIMLVLGELGVNLAPLIASAGIAGVALGFGAQSLVKDCITGLFMIMEDQYGVGDVVDLGEAVGTVEQVALRATVLRGLDGTVWHVPNGEVKRVGNKSQLWSTALVDVDVAYDADLDHARTVIMTTAEEVCQSEEWAADVLEPPQMLGVETLGADGITLRMVVKTAPGAQWALQRALREAFKYSLDGAGIEIPFPQRTVWMRNGES